jgi:hypothetical protein
MKKKYMTPEMEINKFEVEDIIATSTGGSEALAFLLDSGTTEHFEWIDER